MNLAGYEPNFVQFSTVAGQELLTLDFALIAKLTVMAS
jgi:hypothetical protein